MSNPTKESTPSQGSQRPQSGSQNPQPGKQGPQADRDADARRREGREEENRPKKTGSDY